MMSTYRVPVVEVLDVEHSLAFCALSLRDRSIFTVTSSSIIDGSKGPHSKIPMSVA